MAFTRPLSLISAVRIQLTTLTSSAPQKAGPNPVTWKPATNTDTSHRQNAFSTSRNNPRVNRVIGKVSTTRMGRTTALMTPSTSPATSAEVSPDRRMPGTTCAATRSASVYTTTRMMNPMARSRVYTLLLAATLLLLTGVAGAAPGVPGVIVDPARTRGPEAAPVTILEWSDFQCPFCREAQPVLARLLAEFPQQVRLVFKDFPLRSHELAMPAALAARCASAQGRFWEYHDLLYVAQPAFARDELVGYARRLGLDVPGFTECLDATRFQEDVMADQREGRAAGVRATPTFFVNGRKIEGALPIEEFRDAVRRALREAGVAPPR